MGSLATEIPERLIQNSVTAIIARMQTHHSMIAHSLYGRLYDLKLICLDPEGRRVPDGSCNYLIVSHSVGSQLMPKLEVRCRKKCTVITIRTYLIMINKVRCYVTTIRYVSVMKPY